MKKIKIGDNAKVIQGKDKGQIGKIKIIYDIKYEFVSEFNAWKKI